MSMDGQELALIEDTIADIREFLDKWQTEVGASHLQITRIRSALIEAAALLVDAQERPHDFTVEQFAHAVNEFEDASATLLESLDP